MMFRRKLENKGNVCHFVARLVEKGFFQNEIIDYSESFVPAVPYEVLLHLAWKFLSDGWHVHHADTLPHFCMEKLMSSPT